MQDKCKKKLDMLTRHTKEVSLREHHCFKFANSLLLGSLDSSNSSKILNEHFNYWEARIGFLQFIRLLYKLTTGRPF